MKLIVGLGNPGKQYQLTRHNIGFMVLDFLSKRLGIQINNQKFNSLFVKTNYENEEIILMAPQTFMNLSGHAVVNFINYYKINLADVLIIHDDVDLNFGTIQFKNTGLTGGHKGLQNIFSQLGDKNLMRLRVGVGKSLTVDTADWVLNNFNYEELLKISNNQNLLIDAVLAWCKNKNIMQIFNEFNNKKF